jgi:hypothetical protein
MSFKLIIFMYTGERIEFVMIPEVGVLLLLDDIGILSTCKSRIVNVCDLILLVVLAL